MLEEINDQHEDNNMDKVGNQCMVLNDETLDRPVREEVRTMDSMESDKVFCVRRGLRIMIS